METAAAPAFLNKMFQRFIDGLIALILSNAAASAAADWLA